MAMRVVGVSPEMAALSFQPASSVSSSSSSCASPSSSSSRLRQVTNFPTTIAAHAARSRLLTASSPTSSSSLCVDGGGPGVTRPYSSSSRSCNRVAPVAAAAAAGHLALPSSTTPPAPSTTTSQQSGQPITAAAAAAAGGGEEEPQPRNWFQQLASAALDAVERDWIPLVEQRQPLPSTTDPRVQLAGNFAPVAEHPVEHSLEVVEGRVPACLDGTYLRNGANPQYPPTGGHHLFDGDGMVHAVTFRPGPGPGGGGGGGGGGRGPSYCCRYTKTYRYQEELRAGKPVFPKPIGELHGPGGVARLALYAARAACGVLDPARGMGVANAGLVFHAGRLLAMSEDDLPYHVRVTPAGDLHTAGRHHFGGMAGTGVQSMIAHPKVDPATGELFCLSYNVLTAPYLTYFRVSPTGHKSGEVSITLREPTMMHDFAITERFVVVPDQQVAFRMSELLLRGGSPVVYDAAKPARFGLLPRYDADESRMQWIDVPDCFCFHLWNAWEEEGDDEVVVIGSCMTPADSIFNESDRPLASVLSEIRLNRRTGRSSRREIAPGINLEAGQVSRKLVGRRSRYAYLAVAEPWPKVSGIAKVDLTAAAGDQAVVGRIRYPEGCYGGEPCFVPRCSSDDGAAEDDGYILTFMHNEVTGKSQLLILDAQSPTLAPVAKVQLPSRVPYGFHGTYVPASELAKQA